MTDTLTDLASVSLAQPLEDIADELGRSFAEYGFAVVRDHGIPQELIDRAEAKSREFFALPDDVKQAYHKPGGGGARGGGRSSAVRISPTSARSPCFRT